MVLNGICPETGSLISCGFDGSLACENVMDLSEERQSAFSVEVTDLLMRRTSSAETQK